MAETVYITGHKNPDSDSICSSIAYAEFKNKFENKYIPVRQGKLNQETEFILKYFNVPAPEYIETVKTQVSDLNIDKAVHVSKDVSIKTAWMIIKKYKIKTLPIVDKNERLIGIVTLSDITKKYMDTNENNMIAK
ncbi:MAG TPA: inorganic diphosphatase, partial [Clostridiaceae bacterium]|nr:inorganic diphosphatase [Clostridiaceae bacterium]